MTDPNVTTRDWLRTRDTRLMPPDPELLDGVRRVRGELASMGPRRVRSEGDFERVSIPRADADVLRDLLFAEGARSVVEIGLAYASSALAIAEALVTRGSAGARHVIIDAFQEQFHNAGSEAIAAAGLEGVCSLVADRSQIALPQMVAHGFVADAAFVDGSHLFHNVFVDLVFLREIVRPGGLVVLDDCSWPSVATAAQYFELNLGWRPEVIAGGTRLRAYRLPDPRIEPGFGEFQSFAI